MNTELKSVLKNIIEDYGRLTLKDTKRFRSLLKDLYRGGNNKERDIYILCSFIEMRIMQKIVKMDLY